MAREPKNIDQVAVNQIDQLSDYLSYLREHSVEVTRLFKDLLIGVTGFFREPEKSCSTP